MGLLRVVSAAALLAGCQFSPTQLVAAEPLLACDFLAQLGSLPAPAAVAELNSESVDRDPFLTPDGLTIYFSSNREGGSGAEDIWTATRPDRDSPFSTPVPLAQGNTGNRDLRFSLTGDGRIAFLSSDRPGGAGGGVDIFTAARATTDDPFGSFEPVPRVSTENDDHDPVISSDGLRLYWSAPGGQGGQDILVAERPTLDADFGAPETLVSVSSSNGDFDPSPIDDERILVFARDGELMIATRPDRASDFSAPEPIADINTSDREGDPFSSADGCELFFFSNRPGGSGNADLFVVRIEPQQSQ